MDFTIALGNEIGGHINGNPAFSANTVVYVFLYKGSRYVGCTKAVDGVFLFKGLVEGTDYKILVTANGYNNQWFNQENSITKATVVATGNTGLTMTLTAAF